VSRRPTFRRGVGNVATVVSGMAACYAASAGAGWKLTTVFLLLMLAGIVITPHGEER
jgi:hypothetical protein